MRNATRVTDTETTDTAWKGLYKVGGAAALIAAVIFRRNLDAEFMLLRSSGIINIGPTAPPSTIIDWFTLLQNSTLLGLTLLNLFDIVNYALVGLIFLALFAALRRASESFMTIATVSGFIGITTYFASNQAFAMLSLSNQYATAASDAQRAMFLAAGQATLAIHQNNSYAGTGIYLSFLLVSVSGLIMSMVMLRSKVFSKGTAYVGILANSIGLGYYIFLVLAPAVVFLPISVSAIFLLLWYILIARRLFQLGQGVSKEEVNRIGGISQ
jgi:hypothetical protein